MSILDLLESDSGLATLLGWSPAAAATAPTGTPAGRASLLNGEQVAQSAPPPPADIMSPQLSGGAFGSPTRVPTMSFAPQTAAAPAQSPNNGEIDARDLNLNGDLLGFGAQPGAPAPGTDVFPGAGVGSRGTVANNPLANTATGPAPYVPSGAPVPPRVVTANPTPLPPVAPTPPPSAMGANGVPMSNTAGGLNSALGLNPTQPNPTQSILAGIGRGMLQKPNGPFGLQAFMAGAGGGLTGSIANQQQQQNTAFNQARELKNDLFNQQSTFFKDALAARTQAQLEPVHQAQTQMLLARAQSIALAKGSNAWPNTPEGRVATAELRVQQFDTPKRRSIDQDVRSGVITDEQAQARRSQLDKETAQYRRNIYKGMHIDPAEAENLKTLGTQDNPFDASKMTEGDFNTRVPMGGWFKNENGDLMQRVKPPPGSDQPQTAPTGVSGYGVTPEDMMATTPVQ